MLDRTQCTSISTAAASDYLTEYKWDYRNRLTNVTFKNNAGTVTKSVKYEYDVFDRRISKQVDENGNGTFDRSEIFVYDGEDIALRFVDADGDGAQASSLANRYLHGPEVDQVFADEQFDATGQLTNVLWPLADNLGTVRDLANNTGVIINHRLFDAYGRITGETDPSLDHAFAYTGREWDADAGMYYYRARWYDAAVGRFISEDPIGFNGGDTNISRYVANSPTNATDPSGLAGFWGGFWDQVKGIGWQLNPLSLADDYNAVVEGIPKDVQLITSGLENFNAHCEAQFDRITDGLTDRATTSEGWGRTTADVAAFLIARKLATGRGATNGAPRTGAPAGAPTSAAARPAVPQGYSRVYRAVSEAEYRDILRTGRLQQGPNSLEGKWFADTCEGAVAHGRALYADGKFRLIEVDVPNKAPSLFRDLNLDGRGPARYLHNDDLEKLVPRPLE